MLHVHCRTGSSESSAQVAGSRATCSLPHRQLRNMFIAFTPIPYGFTAAQAAQKKFAFARRLGVHVHCRTGSSETSTQRRSCAGSCRRRLRLIPKRNTQPDLFHGQPRNASALNGPGSGTLVERPGRGHGAGERIRTLDPRITSAPLYQLSYAGQADGGYWSACMCDDGMSPVAVGPASHRLVVRGHPRADGPT